MLIRMHNNELLRKVEGLLAVDDIAISAETRGQIATALRGEKSFAAARAAVISDFKSRRRAEAGALSGDVTVAQ
jgi:hypothetical protein